MKSSATEDHAVIVSGTRQALLHLEDRPLAQRLSQIDIDYHVFQPSSR
jgi:hypothetical protein